YHAALIGLITAITGAYLANEATVVWILVEATTLFASVLIIHEQTKYALEATWKYIFLCSVGIAFAYMGILFLGLSLSDGYNLSFAALAKSAASANPLYLKIAFVFIFIGYSTKMEIFPMHTVGIDANSVAPTPIGGLISTAMVNMGFVIIFRTYASLAGTEIFAWMNKILIIAGVLSILVASGYMLKAKHNKRMLAYSSLENAGLVAIALGVGGYGYYAAILLLILHSFVKSSMFFQLGQLFRVLNTMKIDSSGNYMKLYPAGALVLIIGMFALLAVPPSGLFISELMIFRAFIYGNHWFLAVITIILLSVIIYAMSVRIMHICYSEPREPILNKLPEKVNPIETITQFVFIGIVIMMCFYRPPFLDDLIRQSISLLTQL
ncbi:MAG: hydrogenase 4 subunit F, partial [Bacteroidales bacterium]|nr:hydrogenase 4 subunit F [Bacteroidales bacterium]